MLKTNDFLLESRQHLIVGCRRFESRAFAYRIYDHDKIVCVSDNRLSFASTNDAKDLTPMPCAT
ncbi:MAG: hypothetical protein NZM11_07055 [Anaerolineales bacterium]|nr:hypothetical protein [Anaerolineales bacterium]